MRKTLEQKLANTREKWLTEQGKKLHEKNKTRKRTLAKKEEKTWAKLTRLTQLKKQQS